MHSRSVAADAFIPRTAAAAAPKRRLGAPPWRESDRTPRRSRLRLLALLGLMVFSMGTLPVQARPGLVQTLDGRRLTGEVRFTNDALVVDATNTVALTNLQRLAFDLPDAPALTSRGRGPGLIGYYFPNTNHSGNPVVRLDETIAFEWGQAEPAPDVPRDGFSVVWCGEVEAPTAGEFTFLLQADDRARLVLGEHPPLETTNANHEAASPPIALQSGQRLSLRLEFADVSGPARVRLLWSGPEVPKSVVPRDRLYPRACLTNHTVTLAGEARGLLGVYYNAPNFSGETWARFDPAIDFNWADLDPLPGFNRGSFSVRWTGQVLADHAEPYTFAVLADEPSRLWVDGRLLLSTGGDAFFFERRETVMLNAGERHDLRFETMSTGGSASAKLTWSSPSTPKAVIPATHLFPSRPTSAGPVLRTDQTPPGVLLRNGTFVAGMVDRATESSVRLPGRLDGRTISMVNVARIVCQPLSQRLNERITPGRSGVLLARGDFVEAEFRGIERGQVNASSILFGTRTYDARKEAVAVILREAAPPTGAFDIRMADHTRIRSDAVTLDHAGVAVRDTLLGLLRLAGADVAQIERRR